jgi:hypothetical protein
MRLSGTRSLDVQKKKILTPAGYRTPVVQNIINHFIHWDIRVFFIYRFLLTLQPRWRLNSNFRQRRTGFKFSVPLGEMHSQSCDAPTPPACKDLKVRTLYRGRKWRANISTLNFDPHGWSASRSCAESVSSWPSCGCHLTDTRYGWWCTKSPHKCAP